MADDQQMLVDHKKTWIGFTRLVLWSLIGIILTLALMALFLL